MRGAKELRHLLRVNRYLWAGRIERNDHPEQVRGANASKDGQMGYGDKRICVDPKELLRKGA